MFGARRLTLEMVPFVPCSSRVHFSLQQRVLPPRDPSSDIDDPRRPRFYLDQTATVGANFSATHSRAHMSSFPLPRWCASSPQMARCSPARPTSYPDTCLLLSILPQKHIAIAGMGEKAISLFIRMLRRLDSPDCDSRQNARLR
jgi:hypothetical protein